MPNQPLPFPLWMSAVNEAMVQIANRFYIMGAHVPPLPSPGQATYALFADVDPKLAAALILREAMAMQPGGFPR